MIPKELGIPFHLGHLLVFDPIPDGYEAKYDIDTPFLAITSQGVWPSEPAPMGTPHEAQLMTAAQLKPVLKMALEYCVNSCTTFKDEPWQTSYGYNSWIRWSGRDGPQKWSQDWNLDIQHDLLFGTDLPEFTGLIAKKAGLYGAFIFPQSFFVYKLLTDGQI